MTLRYVSFILMYFKCLLYLIYPMYLKDIPQVSFLSMYLTCLMYASCVSHVCYICILCILFTLCMYLMYLIYLMHGTYMWHLWSLSIYLRLRHRNQAWHINRFKYHNLQLTKLLKRMKENKVRKLQILSFQQPTSQINNI